MSMLLAEPDWWLVGQTPRLRNPQFPSSPWPSEPGLPGQGAGLTEFRYKAFISYSWADAAWGKWLHHAIETYRTPKALIGKETAAGLVPARLHPLFKDREEEAAGSSIGGAVEGALAASEFLIVICSPRSARSQWVNHEIAWFKTHRDPSKILALIVDGEPGSADAECFPTALTHNIAADLSIIDSTADTPLAADARDSGDGKRRARLKLAAAMLGVGLDELVGRDERRRAIRTRIVVSASLALATVMSGMAWVAVQARDEAEHQRSEADGLVEFMLTDLREKLEPVGRLDALDVVGQRALKYYAGQRPGDLDADALGRRSRALHLVGELRNIRGDSGGGLNAFRQATATTGELLARSPRDANRIFDHAQSVFWVGYIAYERGEGKEAETQFRKYKRLADQLMAIDPKKPEWQMERSYAESNLGILLYDQARYAEAEPELVSALTMVAKVATEQGNDPARLIEVGAAINWLGKVRSKLHRTDEALALHLREIALYGDVLKADAGNTQAKWLMAVAWQHVGGLEQVRGQGRAATSAVGSSLALMKQLRAIEPGNTEWQETEVRAMLEQSDNLYYLGQVSASSAMNENAITSLAQMVAGDGTNAIWSVELGSRLRLQTGRIALTQGKTVTALELARVTIRQIENVKSRDSIERINILARAKMLAGDALAKLGRRIEAGEHWKAALDEKSATYAGLILSERVRFALFKRLGRHREAAVLGAELDRQGDRHPAYLREKRISG